MTYLLLDAETGNALTSFETKEEARGALVNLIDKDPASAEYVFVVAVDEDGRTVGAPKRLRR